MRFDPLENTDEGPVVGRVRIIRQHDGYLGLGQSWKPSQLTKHERQKTAEALREVADHLDADEFEVDGDYARFPISRRRTKQRK